MRSNIIMVSWLIKKLVDNGWIRLGLAFRWIFGTKKILTGLVKGSELNKIESRYQLIERSGFFSGEQGASRQHAFMQALFARDGGGRNAFDKAMECLNFISVASVAPLEALLNFISRAFFQGSFAKRNKQTFIDEVLRHNNGERNVLSYATRVRNPSSQIELNPLTLVLKSLTESGCFTGEYAAGNKQKIINSICAPNQTGRNALYEALQHVDRDPCLNIKILLDTLRNAGCFDGPAAESNKQVFIQAVLVTAKHGGVLGQAMRNPDVLKQILTALADAGCFANKNKTQTFLDALITPNDLGQNPLYDVADSPDSLELIYQKLQQTGCFTQDDNKQKFINAIFSQDTNGDSALFKASIDKRCSSIMLSILRDAHCFEDPPGSPNQQAFVKAALAANIYGRTCLYGSFASGSQILNQLMNIKYFEGPFAAENKQSFITAALASTPLGGKQYMSALSFNCAFFDAFSLFIDHLTAAGCFSGAPHDPNKQAFINAVFAKYKYRYDSDKNMLSRMYRVDNIILLLKKLEEVGCFDNEEHKEQFRQAVRANRNAILFRILECTVIRNDIRGYLAFHKSLLLAGFSAQDIKKLLNEPIKIKYDFWPGTGATPLMRALSHKNDLLAYRLRADGAQELTKQQKQQVKQYVNKFIKKWQEAEAKLKEPTRAEKLVWCKGRKLERRNSLSDLSLLAAKKSTKNSDRAFSGDIPLFHSRVS